MTTQGMADDQKSTPGGKQQRAPPAAALPVSTAAGDPDALWLLPGETPYKLWDSRIHGFDARDPHDGAVIPTTISGFDE